jgi:hypothetical protein
MKSSLVTHGSEQWSLVDDLARRFCRRMNCCAPLYLAKIATVGM